MTPGYPGVIFYVALYLSLYRFERKGENSSFQAESCLEFEASGLNLYYLEL